MSDYFELGLYISPYTEGEISLSRKQDGGYNFVRRTCIDFIKTDIPQLLNGQYMLQIKAEGYKKYTVFFEVTDKWITYEETDIANPDNTQMKMPFENFVKMRIILTPKEEDDNMYVGDGQKCNDCGKVKGHDCECDKVNDKVNIKTDIENYWEAWKSYEKTFEEHQEAVRKLNEELKDKSEKLKKERSYFLNQIEKYFSSSKEITDIVMHDDDISFKYILPEPCPPSGLVTPIPVRLQLQIIQITNEFSFDVEGDEVVVTLYKIFGE